MGNTGNIITSISASIIGLAALAVIFGSSNTSSTVTGIGNAYSSVIKAAVSPATSED